MVQVDLITGFLGAGKTTFLRRYVRYLVQQGHKVCILENDFGAVNVDAMLVQEVLGPGCDVETISGGCDCDTHQRRMRTKLIAMAMRGFDRVVVEPSGIFDVDEFFDILRDDPLDRWYQLGSVIAIVDALLEEDTLTLHTYTPDTETYRRTADCTERQQLTETTTTEQFAPQAEPYPEMLANFADAILHGTPLTAPGVEGVRALELTDAAYLSAWLGEKITLPLDAERFEQELQKHIQEEQANG